MSKEKGYLFLIYYTYLYIIKIYKHHAKFINLKGNNLYLTVGGYKEVNILQVYIYAVALSPL